MELAAKSGSRRAGVLVAVLVFLAAAPTLRWQEFSSGSENLNVATALEMRRTGQWVLPTLQGQPRLAKPPLTAWITAGLLRESTLRRLADPDAAVRAAAYGELSWQVRWPALAGACLTVLGVYELGRIVGGARLAMLSALVLGTNYAFLRFSRAATTDVQLALWVVAANVFLARALVERKYWTGYLGAGVAIGLAFMSKGPVALVQTLAPAVAFAGWRRYLTRQDEKDGSAGASPSQVPALLTGLGLALAVAVPWFGVVIGHYGTGIWDLWFREVTREGATNLEPSQWYGYVSLFPMMLPWIVFFVAGLIVCAVELRQPSRNPNALLPLFLLVVPVVLMCCFRDKKERYLLPLIGPAAIITARGILVWLEGKDEVVRKLRPALVGVHYAILFGAGVVFPVVGALGLVEGVRRLDGGAWLPAGMGISGAVVGMLILVVSLLGRDKTAAEAAPTMLVAQRRRPGALVGATVAVMVMVQAMFAFGYSQSESGRSDMRPLAEAIWSRYPGAEMASYRPGRRGPEDLSIYLDRIVRPVEDLGVLGALDRPRVLVMYQREGEARPRPPMGWELFASTKRGRGWCHAFVLGGRGSGVAP